MPIQSSSRVIACGIALSACLAAGPADARDDVLHWRVNSLLYPKIFGEAGTHFSETVYRCAFRDHPITGSDNIRSVIPI